MVKGVQRSEINLDTGIRKNLPQYSLLMLLTVFTGWFLGVERILIPVLADDVFHITSYLYLLSFLVTFGFTKAILNLYAGKWADSYGRKKILIAGWIMGIPVPVIFYYANSWNMIIVANIAVGFNQALTWTMTVTSGIDLSSTDQRGFTVGGNEASGYMGQASAGIITGYLVASYGIRGSSALFSMGTIIIALFFAVFFLRETHGAAKNESSKMSQPLKKSDFGEIFMDTSWRNRKLFSFSQGGLIEKFADTFFWGVMPIFLLTKHYDLVEIAFIVAAYQLTWGILQIFTGILSDRIGRLIPIVSGFWIVSIGFFLLSFAKGTFYLVLTSSLTGVGMALLYPVLIAAVNDNTNPAERGRRLGVYRLWRDSGYAFGAIFIGLFATFTGILHTMYFISGIMALSGSLILLINVTSSHD